MKGGGPGLDERNERGETNRSEGEEKERSTNQSHLILLDARRHGEQLGVVVKTERRDGCGEVLQGLLRFGIRIRSRC